MKKTLFLFLVMATMVSQVSAQKYFTRDGNINFSASSPLEKIEATNRVPSRNRRDNGRG
ncbi:MAG: hypothetical protein R2787_17785 [Saprospiraceae bacterium]